MLRSTIDAVRAVLQTDHTLAPRDRARLIALLRQPDVQQTEPTSSSVPRLVRRREAASRLGRSLRFVDRLAAQGILPKRRLPNRRRATGILETDLLALIAAEAQSQVAEPGRGGDNQ